MENSAWSSFTRRIPVNASVEILYKAWATRSGLENWFLRKAEFTAPEGSLRADDEMVQAGDNYFWLWHGWGDDHPETRKVTAANGKDFFQFTFTGDCLVSVKITTEKEGNFVALTQEEIPDNSNPEENLHVACSNGWTFYLTNMKSVLEGGLDLRNKDVAIKNVVTA